MAGYLFLMGKFKPSAESVPDTKASRALAYLKQTAATLDKQLEGESIPSWVEENIIQAAIALSLAASYGQAVQDRRDK